MAAAMRLGNVLMAGPKVSRAVAHRAGRRLLSSCSAPAMRLMPGLRRSRGRSRPVPGQLGLSPRVPRSGAATAFRRAGRGADCTRCGPYDHAGACPQPHSAVREFRSPRLSRDEFPELSAMEAGWLRTALHPPRPALPGDGGRDTRARHVCGAVRGPHRVAVVSQGLPDPRRRLP